MTQHTDWPPQPPDPGDDFGREIAKKLYQAQLDAAKEARKAALDAEAARTAALARQYVEEGQKALDALPESPYRDSMAGLAEFVLVRDS